jgi:parallel beta-helix repeat protein
LLPLFFLPHTSRAANQTRLVVSNTPGQCPQAKFTKIQDAVNAAVAGDTIRVCNGVYAEQVTINKPLDINADPGAFLVPSSVQQNSSSLATGDAIAAALLVTGASNVTISGLTVDGINNGIASCSPRLIGVYFQNSSGTVNHATVRNFKLGVSFNGCQSGTGIFVESGSGGTSDVEIANSSIHDFQKDGITVNEMATQARIRNNVVTGLGPTTGAAQNGIQIGFGAQGTIRENTVTNNVFAPCNAIATCDTVATNILVTQSDDVRIVDNIVGISQIGIFVDGNNSVVRGNTAFASTVFEGIRVEGDGNTVNDNRVVNGGEAGIFLAGNNNAVQRNQITDAPIGILKAAGSAGNVINGNDFFNVAIEVQDPPLASLKMKVVAER